VGGGGLFLLRGGGEQKPQQEEEEVGMGVLLLVDFKITRGTNSIPPPLL
jgi:hypothetical protein